MPTLLTPSLTSTFCHLHRLTVDFFWVSQLSLSLESSLAVSSMSLPNASLYFRKLFFQLSHAVFCALLATQLLLPKNGTLDSPRIDKICLASNRLHCLLALKFWTFHLVSLLHILHNKMRINGCLPDSPWGIKEMSGYRALLSVLYVHIQMYVCSHCQFLCF